MNDLLTIFLSTSGFGGILNVIDNTGGSSTIANPDTPVTVVGFPCGLDFSSDRQIKGTESTYAGVVR